MSIPATITAHAPAKINLTLRINGKRPDGFHDLESWVAPIDFYDVLTFTPANELSLSVHDADDLAAESDNLVLRAARALANEAGISPAISIRLEKRIPIGAGLGGGSSDAATTFMTLNSLWGLDWPIERIQPIAAQLGSDVPLFLYRGQAVIRGRGEIIEPVSTPWQGWCGLILPKFSVSTAAVYGKFVSFRDQSVTSFEIEPDISAHILRSRLYNDLEQAAFAVEPRLHNLHRKIDGIDDVIVRMTGSGSTLFSVFDNQDQASIWSESAQGVLGDEAKVSVVAFSKNG